MGFLEYFQAQADVADDLYDRGFRINCHMGATASLDALAAIWEADFPADAAQLSRFFGGSTPAAARLSRFVWRFTQDLRAETVAVIRFCEDAVPYASRAERAEVDALLAARQPTQRGQLPPAHMDLSLDALEAEAPTLFANSQVRRLAEEYQYPGLLYTLYRCPTVHSLSYPRQAQGFARGEEVFYMPLHSGFTSIGFGHKLLTNWLRRAVEGYVQYCATSSVEPGRAIDPGADQEARLAGKWRKALNP